MRNHQRRKGSKPTKEHGAADSNDSGTDCCCIPFSAPSLQPVTSTTGWSIAIILLRLFQPFTVSSAGRATISDHQSLSAEGPPSRDCNKLAKAY